MQELERLSLKFSENVLDATKKFEKVIIDKKEIEGLPATALGLAAQTAVSKVFFSKSQHMFAFSNGFSLSSLVQFMFFCDVIYVGSHLGA